jgi:N-glycosylase/DNA lyase
LEWNRLRSVKIGRVEAVYGSGFCLRLYRRPELGEDPMSYISTLSRILSLNPGSKTIIFSLRLIDISKYIVDGRFIDIPADIPLPIDYHLKTLAVRAGLISKPVKGEAARAWAAVLKVLRESHGVRLSPFILDSIIWFIGHHSYMAGYEVDTSIDRIYNALNREVEYDMLRSLVSVLLGHR